MNELFSVEEVAEKLAISKWTVRAHLKRGAIKTVRLGRRVLIPRQEVERIVNQGLPSLGQDTKQADPE